MGEQPEPSKRSQLPAEVRARQNAAKRRSRARRRQSPELRAKELAYHKEWRAKGKALAIEYKGGACEHCGLVDIADVMEFHHRNPNAKEYTLARIRAARLSDKVKAELDKCALLCANCHRREHYRLRQEAAGCSASGSTPQRCAVKPSVDDETIERLKSKLAILAALNEAVASKREGQA